ncbi:TcaA NTF2-like domain-containing protein [Niallia sp. Krafla_26]|uniref:TcaA NTF2-like domain-containing protein n=1 Tax=Niallia sp. Krafla_26 TaxID=3064703 RepID=UPI003D174049
MEKGKEKEKIGSDVSEWSYSFSSDGSKVFYLTTDSSLYMKKAGEDRTKLASDVYEYKLAADEESIYVLDAENELSTITFKDETETEVASDVISFTVSDHAIVYTNKDGMLYKVHAEGEKEKLSKMEIVSPDVSYDTSTITYLEEYNFEKGYGELYIQFENGEREKVASDISEQLLTPDGSKVYYITSDDILNVYHVDKKEKVKLGSDVESYRVDEDHLVYLNHDGDLYQSNGNGEPVKVGTDIEEYGLLGKGDVYFLTKDKNLFFQEKGKEKTKAISDIENLYVRNGFFYYLTMDNKIGYLTADGEKPEVLLEELQDYSIIYAEEYLLYQKQLKLADLKGYWFNAKYNFFLSITPTDDEQATLGFYDSSYEDETTITLNYAGENSLSVSDEYGSMEIKLINPKTIEIYADGETQTFTQSNEDALVKMRKKDVASDDRYIEKETDLLEEVSSNGSEGAATSVSREQVSELVSNYIELLIDAIEYNEFSLVEPTLIPDSALYSMQKDLVKNLNSKGITEDLLNYNVLDVREGVLPGEFKVDTYEVAEIFYSDGTSEIQEYYWTYTVIANDDVIGLSDIEKTK